MLNAGLKNRRIVIQERGTTQNAMGQITGEWTERFTLWAQVLPASGSEGFSAKQFNPEVTNIVKVDFSVQAASIIPSNRITYKDKSLDILAIVPGKNDLDEIVITCKERVCVTGDSQ